MESIRALIRAVSRHEKDILRMSDENIFALSFIQQQRQARTTAIGEKLQAQAQVGHWGLVHAAWFMLYVSMYLCMYVCLAEWMCVCG